VIGVVAAVRGQIEGDRQPLLARGEVAPVKRVALLGRREPRVLPDRPAGSGWPSATNTPPS
jgi:hypothetical protein